MEFEIWHYSINLDMRQVIAGVILLGFPLWAVYRPDKKLFCKKKEAEKEDKAIQ